MKYLNKKIQTPDGKFDSLKEYKRWEQLVALEDSGVISKLQRQVRFELVPKMRRTDGYTERSLSYIADFVYFDGDEMVVEDVKPSFTSTKAEKRYKTTEAYKTFVIKRKLMLALKGIEIKEV